MFHLGLPGSPVGLPGSSEVPKSCRTLEAVCPREQTLRCAERREAVRSVAKRRGAAWMRCAERREAARSCVGNGFAASGLRQRGALAEGSGALAEGINQRSQRGALAHQSAERARSAGAHQSAKPTRSASDLSAEPARSAGLTERINQRSQRAALAHQSAEPARSAAGADADDERYLRHA